MRKAAEIFIYLSQSSLLDNPFHDYKFLGISGLSLSWAGHTPVPEEFLRKIIPHAEVKSISKACR